jgi:mono/diheme cytochrome c family protein
MLVATVPSLAKPAFVKQAQGLGFKDVVNCASCHQGAPKKTGPFTSRGQYLVDQKNAKKATEIDLTTLSRYKKQ